MSTKKEMNRVAAFCFIVGVAGWVEGGLFMVDTSSNILGFLFFIGAPLGWIIGIVAGHNARKRIRSFGGKGLSLALCGMSLSYFGLIGFAGLLCFFFWVSGIH